MTIMVPFTKAILLLILYQFSILFLGSQYYVDSQKQIIYQAAESDFVLLWSVWSSVYKSQPIR